MDNNIEEKTEELELDFRLLDLEPVDEDQYIRLVNVLSYINVLYSRVFELSVPYWTNSKALPTAAVQFNLDGEFVGYIFNREFWEGLTEYQRLFIICHETLHVLLNHGERFKLVTKDYAALNNVAADIVINEMLVSKFKFNRRYLGEISQSGCWIDTVFSKIFEKAQALGMSTDMVDSVNPDNVKRDMNYEYYLRLMIKFNDEIQEMLDNGSLVIYDTHSSYAPGDSEALHEALQGSITPKEIGEEELKALESNMEEAPGKLPGTTSCLAWAPFTEKRIPPRKTWLTLIKKLTKKAYGLKQEDSWKKENYRFSELIAEGDFSLPGKDFVDELVAAKQNVWVFMDISGSCVEFGPRFLKAIKSIPEDKFNVRGFIFDTVVHEIDFKKTKSVPMGGGTAFCIIENKIQEIIAATSTSYPALVFLITDGYGTRVSPKYPKRWHILFTDDYGSTGCFPDECNFYPLSQFDGEKQL